MRWSEEYVGLMIATVGFGAVLLWASGAPWYGAAAVFLVVAIPALMALVVHAHRTPKMLLVAQPPGRPLYRLQEALDDAGYALKFCPGPERRPCPVFEGKRCPIGGFPRAALVFSRSGRTGPLPPCGRALGIPMLEIEEETTAAVLEDGRARIGWRAGPDAIVHELGSLLPAHERG